MSRIRTGGELGAGVGEALLAGSGVLEEGLEFLFERGAGFGGWEEGEVYFDVPPCGAGGGFGEDGGDGEIGVEVGVGDGVEGFEEAEEIAGGADDGAGDVDGGLDGGGPFGDAARVGFGEFGEGVDEGVGGGVFFGEFEEEGGGARENDGRAGEGGLMVGEGFFAERE